MGRISSGQEHLVVCKIASFAKKPWKRPTYNVNITHKKLYCLLAQRWQSITLQPSPIAAPSAPCLPLAHK